MLTLVSIVYLFVPKLTLSKHLNFDYLKHGKVPNYEESTIFISDIKFCCK